MEQFEAKTFDIPELKGISKKNIDEHLKLYQGYVKFANYIQNQIHTLSKDSEKWAYELGELQRRFSFEFCGMRNHEYYFGAFESGSKELSEKSALRAALEREFGSLEAFLGRFKAIAMTRGVGWAILYYDRFTDRLLAQWIDEQHIGQLTGLTPVLTLDMWEHSYVYDYPTSEKKKYIEAFFDNLNWKAIEKNFEEALG